MDLKAQNILLTGGDSPKLKIAADFGFRAITTEVSGVTIHLTQVRPAACCGHHPLRVPVRRAPFASETHEDLLRKIASPGPDPCLAGREVPLTAACQDLLTRLLQRDPRPSRDARGLLRHSFIDLDHAPIGRVPGEGQESGAAGGQGGHPAGNSRRQFRLYRLALTYLVPSAALRGAARRRKSSSRDRIYEYMSRAEYLQSEVTQGRPKRPPVAESRWNRLA
uniref:non-specific serine/threonine protein kinase n=1 Tax=Macrostomum lignano TaxID=282301 RepID=A0A1I8F8L7_9PLAT